MKTNVFTQCHECGGRMVFDDPHDLGVSSLGGFAVVTLALTCESCLYTADLEVILKPSTGVDGDGTGLDEYGDMLNEES